MKEIFVLYSCCIPVKGARRAVIIDVQRGELFYIPLGMFEMLNTYSQSSKEELLTTFKDDIETINEYFDFLTSNELGFWSREPEKFPKIDLSWDYPAQITNAILDIDNHDSYSFQKAIDELDTVHCHNVFLRFFDTITTAELIKKITIINQSRIRCIDIVLPHQSDELDSLNNFVKESPRIRSVMLTSAHKSELTFKHSSDSMGNIYLTTDVINAESNNQHSITKDSFVFNINMISESLNFNTFLNRKISIDSKGYIKNTPSFDSNFGHIDHTAIQKVVEMADFQKYWRVTKDQISTCKDCEYRHSCLSYVEKESEVFQKPKACNYDPYNAKWN